MCIRDRDSVFVVHHVTLTGLTPGTKYHYRCGGSAGLSNDCIFRTAPAGIQPYTFVLIADIQNSSFSSPFNSCAKYMKEQDVSFVVQLGDIVQNGCYVNEWNNLFESGKPIFDNAPFMVCIGTNHDVGYQGIEANFCQDIFKFPSNKTLSQYRSLWYSFEYSNSVFTSMYTESNLNLQKPFMDSVFKNTTCPWKFSYWHTNPYSTGGHGGDGLVNMLPNFLAVVDTYNIATVFNGHSHAYEFTHPILKVGNPPVISNATVNWSTRKATANHSQGTVFYNGAGFGGSAMNTYSAQGLPQQFTLTGDSAGGDYTLLLGTVYSDSIVYKVVYYQDCKTFKKGDVLFTYKIINDAPGTKYTLTVNSGSGSGNYNASTPVVITASAPASGKVFDKWTGDVTNVANINAASTTITMPAANTVITATYKDAPPSYTLTVNSGSGSGSYTSGAVVNIIANTPTVGKVFDKWTGDVTGIANVNASSTTITMPASAAGITATYKDAPPNTYTLTVTSGTGSGNYTAGTVVNITANAPATGKIFDKWTGDITGIADVNNSSTIITIPAVNIGIAALYKDIENALREENSRVKIYPNPASDILIIETEGLGEAIIKIVDMTGNTLSVIKSNETEKLKLSVSHLVDGVYIIEIMHNNSVKYIKLCKQ